MAYYSHWPPSKSTNSAAGTQSFVYAYGDGLPRGHDANRQADAHGEQRRRGDDVGIKRPGRKPRRSAGAYQRCSHNANDSPRERKRTRERGRRQQNPVDEQLPEHTPRASTQRETNRDRVAPRQGARQRHAGKVGAGDRQEDPRQRQKHPERGAVPVAQGRKARSCRAAAAAGCSDGRRAAAATACAASGDAPAIGARARPRPDRGKGTDDRKY